MQSTKTQTNTMVAMRDDAFHRLQNNMKYHIRKVIESPFPEIARKVLGTMQVPWYLNQRIPGPHVRIVRDTENWFGLPQFQGFEEIEFEILIPNSLINGSRGNRTDSRFVQFGHGLFSDYTKIEEGYLRTISNRYGYIIGAVSWLGMTKHDEEGIVEMISLNISNFQMIPDRLHQGMLNALCFMKLLLSPDFVKDDIFRFESIHNGTNQTVNVLSAPYKRNFYGYSLGGIMGTVYMALTTDVTHGTAGVPGIFHEVVYEYSMSDPIFFDESSKRYDLLFRWSFLVDLAAK